MSSTDFHPMNLLVRSARSSSPICLNRSSKPTIVKTRMISCSRPRSDILASNVMVYLTGACASMPDPGAHLPRGWAARQPVAVLPRARPSALLAGGARLAGTGQLLDARGQRLHSLGEGLELA